MKYQLFYCSKKADTSLGWQQAVGFFK